MAYARRRGLGFVPADSFDIAPDNGESADPYEPGWAVDVQPEPCPLGYERLWEGGPCVWINEGDPPPQDGDRIQVIITDEPGQYIPPTTTTVDPVTGEETETSIWDVGPSTAPTESPGGEMTKWLLGAFVAAVFATMRKG